MFPLDSLLVDLLLVGTGTAHPLLIDWHERTPPEQQHNLSGMLPGELGVSIVSELV